MNISISKCFLLPLLILMLQWTNREALEVVSEYEEVLYGETVVLKCRSNDGYHNFDYWLINNGLNIVGPSNSDYDEAKYKYEVLSGDLTVKHVSEAEEGIYSCVSRAIRGKNVRIGNVKMLVISQNWEEAYEHDKHINAIRILIVLITLVLLGIGGYVIWRIWKDRFKYPGYLEQVDGGESREEFFGSTNMSRSRSPGSIVVNKNKRDNTKELDVSIDSGSFLDTSNKDQED